MRYNLGLMDKYPIEAAGSTIENNPMYRIVFKQPIDPIRLERAFYKALEYYPLFKTKVMFDKEYYLETNDKPLRILNQREEARPSYFGVNTNDYPWICCYHLNKMTFEWLHGVSDGVGALKFLKQVLLAYFEFEIDKPSKQFLLAPGLEPFFDSKEKGDNFSVDPEGFSFNDFPYIANCGYETDCHQLTADTNEILEVAKTCQTSVAPIITVLFSQAIRNCLSNEAKNRNVACNVVLDLRRPLNYETMHNCVEYKRMTFQDRHAQMSFMAAVQDYKRTLDNARKVPNVVRAITERVKIFKLYHLFPSKNYLRQCVNLVGLFMKNTDCNFVFTYPGKIDLPKEILECIENIDFKVWHDFGQCIIACVDYNGKFNCNISENFVNKNVVNEFVRLARGVGIHFSVGPTSILRQSTFKLEEEKDVNNHK